MFCLFVCILRKKLYLLFNIWYLLFNMLSNTSDVFKCDWGIQIGPLFIFVVCYGEPCVHSIMNCEDLFCIVCDFYFSFLQIGKRMVDFSRDPPHWKSPGIHSREINAQGLNGTVIQSITKSVAVMEAVIVRAQTFLLFYQYSITEIIICTLSVIVLQGLLWY